MSAQKPTLNTLVESSRLLKPKQRQALLRALPSLNAEQAARLRAILEGEPAVVQKAMAATIDAASKRNDTAFFVQLDSLFAAAASQLSKAEEPFEKADEDEQLKHFFDAA